MRPPIGGVRLHPCSFCVWVLIFENTYEREAWDLIASNPEFQQEKAETIGVTDEELAEGEKEGYDFGFVPSTLAEDGIPPMCSF